MPSTHTSRAGQSRTHSWARWVNVALGAWLVVSVFVWQHSDASRANTMGTGAAIAIVAIAAMTWSSLRALNMILAMWLLFSTLLLFEAAQRAEWINALVALVVFTVSILPSRGEFAGRRTATTAPPI